MKKKILKIVSICFVFIVIGININAVAMSPQYSDNVTRYVLRGSNKTNLINKTISVKPKTTYNLDYKRGSKYINATYTSGNTKVATVNKTNGVIGFKKTGKVTIYVKGSDNRQYRVYFSVGETYVVVSIASQRARLYVNGKLRKSVPVVTGKPGRTSTPKGTWKIAYKTRNTYLDGATVGYDYYLKVRYWIPLAGTGGVGFHDAPWRSNGAFGGKIYKYDGSHGCINMRTKDAAYFYKYLKAGTVIKII